MEVVVAVKPSWLCVVIVRKLRSKGGETTRQEMERIAGVKFDDFCIRDDGLGDDCYAFLKCSGTLDMDGLRRHPGVVTVLESYDNPSYLTDQEVDDFLSSGTPSVSATNEGDAVSVMGEGTYAGLYGVVVSGGEKESEVMFRFHTVTRYEWLSNKELIVGENILSRLK